MAEPTEVPPPPSAKPHTEVDSIPLRELLEGMGRLSLGSWLLLAGVLGTLSAGSFGVGQFLYEFHHPIPGCPGPKEILVEVPGPPRLVGAIATPSDPVVPVKALPAAGGPGIQLLKDISIFDLRAWVPPSKPSALLKESPVHYTNYLLLRKTSEIDSYVMHYSTGGYGIDLRSITHRAKVSRQESPDRDHPNEKPYAITVDISREPLGTDFLVLVEGTFWNGFSDLTTESASTYTDDDAASLTELAIVILFPEDKRFQTFALKEGDEPFEGLKVTYEDRDKRLIYWNIRERAPNRHYTIEWQW